MLKWCPCARWCLTDPAAGGEAKVLLNSMTTPAYNVRRISSFGQTVINEAGEEEEVLRHGTLPTAVHNGDGPPWSANAIPVQPGTTTSDYGVSKSDVAARMHRMASIPEAYSPKSKNRLKKSLSETDRYFPESPLRCRKKIHTPEEFAEVFYHRDNDSEINSVASEVLSERSKNIEDDKTTDTPAVSVPASESCRQNTEMFEPTNERKSTMPSTLFQLVKKATAADRAKSLKSGWTKKEGDVDKRKSPVPKPKISMEMTGEGAEKNIGGLLRKGLAKKDEFEFEEVNIIDEDSRSLSRCDSIRCSDEYFGSVSRTPSQSTVPIEDDFDEVTLDGSKSVDSVEIAKQFGLDLNLYNLSDRLGFGGSGNDDLSADTSIARIYFSTRVDKEKNQLVVTIEKVEELGGQGVENIKFDVVVKVGFIKGGHVYSTKPSLSNKPINQNFSLHVKDLATSILRLSVYNSVWQGSHDVLGYALFRVANCLQTDTRHSLNVSPKSNISDSAGMIEVSFRTQSKILYVIVHKIFDILPAYRGYKFYTKVSLFISSKKIKEKVSNTETGEKGYTMFDFESKFKADSLLEHHSFVMISLKKKGENNKLFKHDKTLGRVFLGPLFYTGDKINLWGQALLQERIITKAFSLYL